MGFSTFLENPKILKVTEQWLDPFEVNSDLRNCAISLIIHLSLETKSAFNCQGNEMMKTTAFKLF